ncbi:hypothetical protein ACF064_27380 [Streptomyces sp. NPDC015492]|uniref:hypothetical protein n=1 Tax=Streptomyces sp. NPDC015492 TaxID=3364958 RepID=UPI003702D6F9
MLLPYVLAVLSSTHDQAALPIVEGFLHHPHSEVRKEASEAVTELQGIGSRPGTRRRSS